ncbi:MAG: LicD family protein [Candidatus Limnocylindrales bacterium]
MVSDVSLRQLQLVELDILRYFVRSVTEHGLRYYMIGGTLLGAVRHRGFIPWDDDIDVAMPRPDYDKFRLIMHAGAGSGYEWDDYSTSADYPFVYGKLGRVGTRYHVRRTRHLVMAHEVAIDVFPLDGVPSASGPRLMHSAACRILQLRLSADVERSEARASVARTLKVFPRRSAVGGFERLAHSVEYHGSRFVANLGGISGYRRNVMPKSWFGQAESLPFEDMLAAAPTQWHRYLTHVYGDYMQLPPEVERASHHGATWELEPSAAEG